MKHTISARIALAASIAALIALTAAAATPKKSHDAAVARNLNTFSSIVRELETNYVDSIRTDDAFKAAIAAMLAAVDPYTEYYSLDDQQKLSMMQTGEYGGIGSYITERNGHTYITGPYAGSPAAEAGLRVADRIVRIDTTDTDNLGSEKVSALLQGQPGTTVNVRVVRPYVADSVLDFTITRRKVFVPSVTYAGIIDGRTGYIRLEKFIEKTGEEVRAALDSFKRAGGVEEVVLDLRGNGGGVVEAAVDVVGMFVPKGTEVLRMRGRDKSAEKVYKTTRSPLMPDVPLAVLIDGGSASASEIAAGALQDLDRAVLVGTRSYGKGLVQGTRSLPYDGVLKITVAKYYIPSGRLIQALDYSHRNPDGSVARVPDSLTNVFHTLHGREVRDGGGLQPDSVVSWGTANRLVYNLMTDNIIFDFGTKYAAEHPTVPAPADFVVTDEIYDEFKRFVRPEDVKYDKVCEDLVAQLRKVATAEGYMNEATSAQLDSLGKLLTHDLNHDLDTHRDQIADFIASDLMRRYYFEAGEARQQLSTDVGMKKALEILRNPAVYRRTLGRDKSK